MYTRKKPPVQNSLKLQQLQIYKNRYNWDELFPNLNNIINPKSLTNLSQNNYNCPTLTHLYSNAYIEIFIHEMSHAVWQRSTSLSIYYIGSGKTIKMHDIILSLLG